MLFTDASPRAAENFRRLCTGERGIAPPGSEGAGRPYHFKVCCVCCVLPIHSPHPSRRRRRRRSGFQTPALPSSPP